MSVGWCQCIVNVKHAVNSGQEVIFIFMGLFTSLTSWHKHTDPAFRRGPVCRGQFGEVLSFLRPTVQTIIECPPPAGDNHGWVVFAVRTGFALGHRASTFRACAHLITTAVRYQLRAQGRFSSPEPNMFGGDAGRSPGERPHDVIAGESPA